MNWGPEPAGSGRWRFRLWAPALSELALEIDGRDPVAMAAGDGGWFSAEAPASPGDRYRFRVSKDIAVPDPASRAQALDVHGYSLLIDPDSYRWRAGDWRGRPWEETVIYELHAGLQGGFGGVAGRIPELARMGFTAIELMPVGAFGGARNWGYDGVLPYAPAASYGKPDDLKALVDCAHEQGVMILLDVVYNHFGPEGNYIEAYAPDFFHPEVTTPWGAAIAFDLEPVRRFFIDNALMWLCDYRFDGLRFDAVHAIRDDTFLAAMADEIRQRIEPGRQVHLVLENEANDATLLEQGYDAQWNDDFHNAVHVLLTGETHAYYRDFADRPAGKLARCLAQGFAWQGETSPHLQKPRGTASGHLAPTAFVSFLQNHDQVGNRALGERLLTLTDEPRLRAATALLLLSPQIPLVFMGDETGSRSPFLFFTDFDGELAAMVADGRRREFAGYPGFSAATSRQRIPDPNDPETFERSRPRPGHDAESWRSFYRRLLAMRQREIVPRLAGAKNVCAETVNEAVVVACWRMGGGETLTLFINLGSDPVPLPEEPDVDPLFSLGVTGAPASFAAWLVPCHLDGVPALQEYQ